MLGEAYQAGGVWYYPSESFNAVQTGLASVQPDDHASLTTDGERFDQNALAAAHQTLQLPAIARLTNLDNGRQLLVRIDDRGPASPARLVSVTKRTAQLLGFPRSGIARVRLEVEEPESRAIAGSLQGAAGPTLTIEAAPRGDVRAVALAPPPGASGQSGIRVTSDAVSRTDAVTPTLPSVPMHLPEVVLQVPAEPGPLYVDLGTFSHREIAERQRARVAGLAPNIERVRHGRTALYLVRVGPLTTVDAADATLDRAIRTGVSDARIVAE
ncbi:MAG: SPOR domain-containing protein [Acetobacteraceae bacterium]|nr:SPOR domain-containing protein [Acetobacteraceae bacterium]